MTNLVEMLTTIDMVLLMMTTMVREWQASLPTKKKDDVHGDLSQSILDLQWLNEVVRDNLQ